MILVVAGLLTGLGTAVSLNDISEVLPVTGAFLAQLPAVFVLIGVTVALMGWVPRWSAIAWAALAFVVIVGLLGDLLQIPHWVRSISPFDHSFASRRADAVAADRGADRDRSVSGRDWTGWDTAPRHRLRY